MKIALKVTVLSWVAVDANKSKVEVTDISLRIFPAHVPLIHRKSGAIQTHIPARFIDSNFFGIDPGIHKFFQDGLSTENGYFPFVGKSSGDHRHFQLFHS